MLAPVLNDSDQNQPPDKTGCKWFCPDLMDGFKRSALRCDFKRSTCVAPVPHLPAAFFLSGGNADKPGLAGHRAKMTSMPLIYNVESHPREEDNLIPSKAWGFRPYMQAIGAYYKSLEKYPNPKGVPLGKFKQ